MKKIIFLICSLLLFISCTDSKRQTLILGLWCSYDTVTQYPICFDFEPGSYPDGYEELIVEVGISKEEMFTIRNGQFKIEGDKIYFRFPDNTISKYSKYFEPYMELTVKNINENSVDLINSSGKVITLVRQNNPRAI